MKTIKVISATFLTALIVSFSAEANNKTNTENAYTIEAASNSSSTQSSKLMATDNKYTIYFETMDTPLQVRITEEKETKNFIVSSPDFEVMYQLKGNAFGVAYVLPEEASIPKEAMYEKLNRKAFLHQKVITQSPKSEKEYLQLIASYVPELMK